MKKIIFTLFVLALSTFTFAQSADFVTKILGEEQASFGDVCYLSAVCQNLVSENATETEALNAIFEQGIIRDNIEAVDVVRYKDLAVIFCKLWNIKGGLFYRLSDASARYAFNQLKSDGVIGKKIDPDMIPSGVDVLNIYTAGSKIYESAE